jgi:hypothetical protein
MIEWAKEHPFYTFIILIVLIEAISNIFGARVR